MHDGAYTTAERGSRSAAKTARRART